MGTSENVKSSAEILNVMVVILCNFSFYKYIRESIRT